ncbi:hypothetical protein VPHD148_0139 [Vibrio phage D148]
MTLENLLSAEGRNEVYAGERTGCHSSRHWFKVAQLGVLLARVSGGDPVVPLLFGFYHDCRRENDGYDPEHGHRAALLAHSHFQKGWLKIEPSQLDLLMFACEHHNKGSVDKEDPTISACWDADRLDLPRVGIQTDPEFLGTDAAKSLAMYQNNFYNGVCDCG